MTYSLYFAAFQERRYLYHPCSLKMSESSSFSHPQSLLDAFHTNYHRIERAVHKIVTVQSDPTVIARLGDDLDEFLALVIEVS